MSTLDTIYSTVGSFIYGTPVPSLSAANNTTELTPAPANETTNNMNNTSTASTNTTHNLTRGNVSSSSGQQGSPSGNWLALALITIPAILAALIVVVQFVRKL